MRVRVRVLSGHGVHGAQSGAIIDRCVCVIQGPYRACGALPREMSQGMDGGVGKRANGRYDRAAED